MNEPTAAEQRWREILTSSSEVGKSGEPCPPWERIWSSARNELGRKANTAVILHIGECTACGTAWRTVRDFYQAELGPPRAVPFLAGAGKGWALALAASFLVAAIGVSVVYRFPGRQETAPAYRAQEAGWIQPEREEDTPLSRDDCWLRWTAGAEGTTYDVHVTTEDLEPVARGWRLELPEFLVEPEALDDLSNGATILWRVSAYTPGSPVESSRTFRHLIE